MKKKKFLEKEWWLGVQGIATMIGIILIIIIPTVVVPLLVGVEKTVPEVAPTETPVPECPRQRVFLPNENEMWELSIDNLLLTELHHKARIEALGNLHDAMLTSILIYVYPYKEPTTVSIVFTFYSEGADKVSIYEIDQREDMHLISRPIEPAMPYHQATFKELPWIKNPLWLQFVRESYEGASPLSVHERTRYVLQAYATLGQLWYITFTDGVTGKESNFYWYGKGEPIAGE